MKKDPLIIGIETALPEGSLCLARGSTVIASLGGSEIPLRTDTLLNSISVLLDESGFCLDDLDLVAVSAGPGSFTGIRVGMATAQALALAIDRPCFRISTLNAIQLCCRRSDESIKNVIAAVQTNGGRIYWGRFAEGADPSTVQIQLTAQEALIQTFMSDQTSVLATNKELRKVLTDNFKELDAEERFRFASDNVAEIIALYCSYIVDQSELLQTIEAIENTSLENQPVYISENPRF